MFYKKKKEEEGRKGEKKKEEGRERKEISRRKNERLFLPFPDSWKVDDSVTNARHFISNGMPPIIVDPRLNCKEHRRKVECERTSKGAGSPS